MNDMKQPSWAKKALHAATHPIIPGRFTDPQKNRLKYVRAGLLLLNENPTINLSNDEGRVTLTIALSEQFPDFTKNNPEDAINDIIVAKSNGLLGWVNSLTTVDGWQSGKREQSR